MFKHIMLKLQAKVAAKRLLITATNPNPTCIVRKLRARIEIVNRIKATGINVSAHKELINA